MLRRLINCRIIIIILLLRRRWGGTYSITFLQKRHT